MLCYPALPISYSTSVQLVKEVVKEWLQNQMSFFLAALNTLYLEQKMNLSDRIFLVGGGGIISYIFHSQTVYFKKSNSGMPDKKH